MAQWEALLRLDAALQSRVSQLYEGKLHRDIRALLSSWIENQDWDSAAADEDKARTCFHNLQIYLGEQCSRSFQENTILQGPNFFGMKDYLTENFQNEPLKLAVILAQCLKEEKNILAANMKPEVGIDADMKQKWWRLDMQINKLKHQTADVKKGINTLEDLTETLDYVQKTWESEAEQHAALAQSSAQVQEQCLKKVISIMHTIQFVCEQMVNILKHTEQTMAVLLGEELPMWKRRQQLACIGCPVNTDLQPLQKWFTSVAEVLLGVRDHLQKLQEQILRRNITDSSALPATMAQIDSFSASLLDRLLTRALVVEKQPVMQKSSHRSLILKTNTRFEVTVRFLVNLPGLKLKLKAKAMFDKDVEEVNTIHGFRLFEITSNDSKVLDVDSEDSGLMAEFRNMSVMEKKSRIKGSADNRLGVTEELHVIKFVTTCQLAGLQCDVEASSLPFVVISSTGQARSAWAAIMWWNLLSSSEPWDLSLFLHPPPLSWELLSQALSWQFLSVSQRGLDADQLAMLRDKMGVPEGLMHWSTFSGNENAWAWIDAILDLIKKHLVDFWRDGFIMGFVSRKRTRSLLLNKPPGTFLLRFSESNPDGAITFSWVDNSSGENRVHHVDPYKKSELESLSIPDIIYEYRLMGDQRTRNPLLYLYPDIPKDQAFKRYCRATPEKPSPPPPANGYLNRKLVSTSIDPTPPPSPPDVLAMETDNQPLEDLVSTLLDWTEEWQEFQLAPTPAPLSDFCNPVSSA